MISAEQVSNAFIDCLFRSHEIVDGKPIVEPIKVKSVQGFFGLHPERVESHKKEVGEWLLQLSDDFFESGGGGMSFLQICEDRNHVQWTGMHKTCNELVALGIAAGYVQLSSEQLSRILPGGVPYVIIHDEKIKNAH